MQQEIISDTVVNNIRKVKFVQLLLIFLNGTHFDIIKICMGWRHMQNGVSGGWAGPYGECAFQEVFTFNCSPSGLYM